MVVDHELDLPSVLSARIRISANTCADVSYEPLVLEPHSGFSPSSLRRLSSARIMSVGIEAHDSPKTGGRQSVKGEPEPILGNCTSGRLRMGAHFRPRLPGFPSMCSMFWAISWRRGHDYMESIRIRPWCASLLRHCSDAHVWSLFESSTGRIILGRCRNGHVCKGRQRTLTG